jgi:hypothetical protein
MPHEVTFAAVVEASVTHTAACVPECTICYPKNTENTENTEESED